MSGIENNPYYIVPNSSLLKQDSENFEKEITPKGKVPVETDLYGDEYVPLIAWEERVSPYQRHIGLHTQDGKLIAIQDNETGVTTFSSDPGFEDATLVFRQESKFFEDFDY